MIGKQKTTTTTKHSEWHHRFSLLWSNHHLLEDGSTKLVSLQGSNFTSSHCDTLFKATCHVVVCFVFFYAPCRSQSNPHAPDNLHSPITADVLPPSRLTSSLRWMMMVQLSPGWGASSWREAALQRVELALEEEERGGGVKGGMTSRKRWFALVLYASCDGLELLHWWGWLGEDEQPSCLVVDTFVLLSLRWTQETRLEHK